MSKSVKVGVAKNTRLSEVLSMVSGDPGIRPRFNRNEPDVVWELGKQLHGEAQGVGKVADLEVGGAP